VAAPHVSFVVIGPYPQRIARLSRFPNVHVLGPRPYKDLPAYLQHASVGLIPFRRKGIENFVDDINPLKLYEYMAAGLAVVTTPIGQVEAMGAPAVIARDAADFAEAIVRLAGATSDRRAERDFAARFDWSRQFEPLTGWLDLRSAAGMIDGQSSIGDHGRKDEAGHVRHPRLLQARRG